MIIYLAGAEAYANFFADRAPLYCLVSFHYVKEDTLSIIKPKGVLLDSGAFTYLKAKKGEVSVNWDDYIERYADFIIRHGIINFLELDIDNLVGLAEVERLRKKLETLTNRLSIPVWHKSRGIEKYYEICKSHPYIAIGGIVTKEIKKKEHPVFNTLLRIARQHNTKVHGLGFTSIEGLYKYKFHSVDSTTWINARFGKLNVFENGKLSLITNKEKKLKDWKECTVFNLNNWEKFQKYAEINL